MVEHKLERLTYQEKKLAEENHNLVYGFLRRYQYDISEYYNITIFGYLKGIQIYSRRADLQEKYDLPFITWQYMRSEIGNHFRMEKTQKRMLPENSFSIDADINDIPGDKSAEDEVMEQELISDILDNLSEIQRKITLLKIDGYTNKEVYLLMNMKPSTYYSEISRMKRIVENILAG